MVDSLKVRSGENELTLTIVDNVSTRALVEKLKQGGDITISVSDYGGFEKVGELPWTLPSDDTRISTGPGDVVLYQSRNICFYYGNNTWSFTRIGRFEGVSAGEIQEKLASNVVTLSLD